MVASLGIPTYGIRACAQVRDDKKVLSRTVQEIFIINACMTTIVYIFFFLSICFVGQFRQEKTLFLLCGSTMFFNLIGMEWLYKALEQYQYITIRSIAVKLISLILMLLMIQTESDYLVYGGLTILASVGSNILNFVNVRKLISLVPCRPYHMARHIKPIFTFFALTVASTIYTHLDVVMLGFLTDNQQVGYYNTAIKIKELLITVVTSLGAVLLPRLSYYVQNRQMDKVFSLIRKSFDFILFIAAPVSIYFIIMADKSILFLVGPAYMDSIVPMQIIMPTVFLIGLSNLFGMQLLVPTGREKLVVLSTCVGALIDIILNWYYIPKLASTGAAIGTLAAEAAVLLVQIWAIRSNLPALFKDTQAGKIFISLVPSTFFLIITRSVLHTSNFITLCLTFAVFSLTYLTVLLLLRYRISFH